MEIKITFRGGREGGDLAHTGQGVRGKSTPDSQKLRTINITRVRVLGKEPVALVVLPRSFPKAIAKSVARS